MKEFHRAIGFALTRWQHVEYGLYYIVHCLLGTSSAKSAIVFFMIRSAETKLSLADQLCRSSLSKEAISDWKKTKREIGDLSKMRNALAHFDVMLLDQAELDRSLVGLTRHPVCLTPNFHDPSAQAEQVRCLYQEQILELAEEFQEAACLLMDFLIDHVPDWQSHIETLQPEARALLIGYYQRGQS